MSAVFNSRSLGRNIQPNTGPTPAEVKRRDRAASRWLAAHDPLHQKRQAVTKLRRMRAARKMRIHA